jgi:hypothetical protein
MQSAPLPPSISRACVPLLLALAACVHDGGSRVAVPVRSAAVPATPAAAAATGEPAPAPRDASASAPAVTPPAALADAQSAAAPTPPRTASPPPGSRSGPAAGKAPPARPAAAAANTMRPAAPAASGASVAALDLNALEQRLRATHAIGVFTKLSLKNQVDDLLAQFKAFYRGQSQLSLAQLRRNYEVLLLKVVSVLQDGDPELAGAVSSSREAIWSVLQDPKKFATI